MGVKIGCGGSSTPDFLVDDLNQDAEKAAKAAREKELSGIEYHIRHLLVFIDASLASLTPFIETKNELVQDRSFYGYCNSRMSSFYFTLSLMDIETPVAQPIFSSLIARGILYSFLVHFRSQDKEIKFYLRSMGLSKSPGSGWENFKELYLKNDSIFYLSILEALDCIKKQVNRFLENKILSIQQKLGLPAGFQHLAGINAEWITTLIIDLECVRSLGLKYGEAFNQHQLLVSQACRDLQDTKGFVKSKKLAQIRENLERKSQKIAASVNT